MSIDGLVQKILKKSQTPRSRRYQFVCLIVDEIFFLVIVPWLLILPAYVVARWIPLSFPRQLETVVGVIALLAGLSYSLWAVSCQWTQGRGTPSLNAPTRQLVVSGPYRLSRNPIQLGSSAYILGLGALAFSFVVGVIAGATALLVGIVYIKAAEEAELKARFGDAYEEYCRHTPFLLPFGSLLRKKREGRRGKEERGK